MCHMRVFFLQAEDGIRDAQESRGLGDVYKRQQPDHLPRGDAAASGRDRGFRRADGVRQDAALDAAVSYTHMTLPTIYSV